MIIFPSYQYAVAKSVGKVEVVKTVPLGKGTYEHTVKICADKNNRLERPNVIVSSDIEEYREQIEVNLPPGFCSLQRYVISANDPRSITVTFIE